MLNVRIISGATIEFKESDATRTMLFQNVNNGFSHVALKFLPFYTIELAC